MVTKAQIRAYMREVVLEVAYDSQTCEVSPTRLAEEAAWHFGQEEWFDDDNETHPVWDIAVEVAESFERGAPHG